MPPVAISVVIWVGGTPTTDTTVTTAAGSLIQPLIVLPTIIVPVAPVMLTTVGLGWTPLATALPNNRFQADFSVAATL